MSMVLLKHGAIECSSIVHVGQPQWSDPRSSRVGGWSIVVTFRSRETPLVLEYGKTRLPKGVNGWNDVPYEECQALQQELKDRVYADYEAICVGMSHDV